MPSQVIDSLFFRDLYGTAQMRAVFEDHTLLQKWLDYEAALARAEAAVGLVPRAAAEEIAGRARAELMDCDEIKKGVDATVHPLISLIRQLSRASEGEAGRYVHWGATTQDVMDTAIVLQIKQAYPLYEQSLDELAKALGHLAKKHRDTPMPGRTHGQHALPITFGFKVAVWLSEIKRHRLRLAEMKQRVLVGQFGGAAGTLASVSDKGFEIRAQLMQELGLGEPDITWHTARDRLTDFTCCIAMICATCGKIAHEIIDLQKTEVGEVEEPFEMGKVGSSTMPQKRNPMLCESILSLARLTRPMATTAIDAMMHEHERDWSSFQMEWSYLPQLCIMTHGAMTLTQRVIEGLIVYPENMLRNLTAGGGLLLAERVMLKLGEHIGRQEAHDVVYEASMAAFERRESFADVLKRDSRITQHILPQVIDELLDPLKYLGLAGEFVDRVIADQRQ